MYDLIGDIHGHADALERLLTKLGYAPRRGCYRHPERQAIFLGDFIDRGPNDLPPFNVSISGAGLAGGRTAGRSIDPAPASATAF